MIPDVPPPPPRAPLVERFDPQRRDSMPPVVHTVEQVVEALREDARMTEEATDRALSATPPGRVPIKARSDSKAIRRLRLLRDAKEE